jgi:pimeloyl-ACP methyl ester carboxylesterase
LLLVHGTDDEILPPDTSAMVQMLAGHGELVLMPGAGHLLTQAATELRERLADWIPAQFASPAR